MGKFTYAERAQVKSLVAELSIKRIPDSIIISQITKDTGKTITRMGLYKVRQSIKRESAKWYDELRQSQYEFLHEYKERINEILDLQRMHHEIIIRNDNDRVYNPAIVQTSLAELHKLNITLSNYFSVAPSISNVTVSTIPERTAATREQEPIV